VTDQELKKLNRQDLLRMLLEAEKENQSLRTELEAAQEKLESRQVIVSEAGSLAEASLRLSGVFEDAQRAANIYVQNAEQVCQEQKRKASEATLTTERNCREMEETCRANCDRLREEAQRAADDRIQNAEQLCREQERKATEATQTTEQKCREMEETCRADCDRLREEAKQWAADYKERIVKPLKEFVQLHPEVFDALEIK